MSSKARRPKKSPTSASKPIFRFGSPQVTHTPSQTGQTPGSATVSGKPVFRFGSSKVEPSATATAPADFSFSCGSDLSTDSKNANTAVSAKPNTPAEQFKLDLGSWGIVSAVIASLACETVKPGCEAHVAEQKPEKKPSALGTCQGNNAAMLCAPSACMCRLQLESSRLTVHLLTAKLLTSKQLIGEQSCVMHE